jgi:hypothetical protein
MNIHLRIFLRGIWVIPILGIWLASPFLINSYARSQGVDIQTSFALGGIPIFLLFLLALSYAVGKLITEVRKDCEDSG